MGGSLARALRATGGVDEIVGSARSEETLQRAVELGVIDRAEADPAAAVSGADVVVVAVPVMSSAKVFASIVPALTRTTIVTDVGSVKQHVVAAARSTFGDMLPRFIPGHPIAGTEQSGVSASFADLYRDKHVVLTPISGITDPDALRDIQAMWTAVGADVLQMDVAQHDELLAMTSHLPHVLAFGLVDFMRQHAAADRLFDLAAAGFYDFTRIASSNPEMWRDICLSNKEAVCAALSGFRAHIDSLLRAIERGDGDELMRVFEQAKHARDQGLADKKS